MSDSFATVRVHDLAKRYGAVQAVRGLNFELGRGEIFGLLGRNGAGKTTTLECVLGLRQPDRGRIFVGGVDAQAEPERARASLGAQLQGAALQDKITPRQALRFFAAFYRGGLPPDALLEQFALGPKADAPFATLSGGQKQRLFLALALVHEPSVLVLDEPTAGLDPQIRRELRTMIAERRAAGLSVLLSTHDLDEAEHFCDRVGILHEGRLIAVGTPGELIAGSRRAPSLVVQTVRSVDLARLAEMAGARCIPAPGGYRIEARNLNRAIAGLGEYLGATGNEMTSLQVQRPTLEDVFVELTGGPWEEVV